MQFRFGELRDDEEGQGLFPLSARSNRNGPVKRSTLEFIQRAVTSAVSARNVVRLALVVLSTSAAQTLQATDTFTESWNLMRQDEQTQGTPGSYLGEIRRRQDGLPVADRFLLEESELQSEADSAVLPVPDARASRLFQEDAGRWIGVSAAADAGSAAQESVPAATAPETAAAAETALKTPQLGDTARIFRTQPADSWQLLPNGLLYRTYMAGPKEPRLQMVYSRDTKNGRNVGDSTLGGRAGLFRITDSSGDAFQLDIDGAVFARILPSEPSTALEGSDYRVGLFGTWKRDTTAFKFGYAHISSHIGDEFLELNPGLMHVNYVRDSLVAGISQDLTDAHRIYAEIGYAAVAGGAKPLEGQLGAEWTPRAEDPWTGAPFVAVNGIFREEQGSNVGLNSTAGWGWQGAKSSRRLRVGANWYNGPSLQYSFVNRWENLVGGGIWLDF